MIRPSLYDDLEIRSCKCLISAHWSRSRATEAEVGAAPRSLLEQKGEHLVLVENVKIGPRERKGIEEL